MQYQLGDVATLRGSFVDEETQSGYDPATVKVFVRTPRGVESVHVYGVDAGVVRDGTGMFRFDLAISLSNRGGCSGLYYYRWVGYDSDGVPQAGAEGAIDVAPSHFVTPY